MPTFNNIADTTTHFFFNHVISLFGVPLQLISDHGKHFENYIFMELSSRLGFSNEFFSPYYPHSNGKVEAVNKVLKTMLQRMVNKHKINWNHMLFSVLWAYRKVVKNATGFTPFHLVHGVESTLPIECKIPTLRTAIEILPDTDPMEQRFLNLESLDEDRLSSLQKMKQPKNGQRPPLIAMSTFAHFTKETSSSLTISLTIPSSMENSNPSVMDRTSSNIASLKSHTS
jgi:transposase InsO family protein